MKMETLIKSRRLQHLWGTGRRAAHQWISSCFPAKVLGKAPWISIFLAQQLRIFRSKHNKMSFCLCFFFSSCLTTSTNRFTLSCCPKSMKKETWLRNLHHNTFLQFFHPSRRKAFPPIFLTHNYSDSVTDTDFAEVFVCAFFLKRRKSFKTLITVNSTVTQLVFLATYLSLGTSIL